MRHISLLALLSYVATALPLVAQGPDPIGRFDPAQPLSRVATLGVPALDRPAIAAQDIARQQNRLPARYAIPNPVHASPATHGTWETLDETWSLWRLRVRSPGASHVNLGFTSFHLPGTARVMVYSSDYTHIVRPFDAGDQSPAGELWTPVILSEEIVVELYVQTAHRPRVNLVLGQVGSGYRFFGAGPSAVGGTDGSGACNIDVVCPQGAGWVAEIPAIAAISTGGSVFCTGFMVNNTAQDGRNFFMTAYHCGIRSNSASSLVVYWNYENTVCSGPNNGTFAQFNTGSSLRANHSVSDVTLVELNNTPNPAWGITYVGWDRSGADATSAVAIHHPSGDPKKISFENQSTQTTSYLGTSSPGNGTHVRVVDWDAGTTEPGSSGSPLFDQNHRAIGQLHGGYAACGNNTSDWYGKFSVSWSGGGSNSSRLSNWLDPLNTGATALDTLGSNRATAIPYGVGCYQSFATFFELFGSGTFDLAGSPTVANSVLLAPNGNGFTVTPGSNTWRTPTSGDLGLGDDSVSNRLSLPFVFQYPGGSTNALRMCSNGYIWLNGTSTGADYTPSSGELVSDAPRLCPLWMDLNPAAGGTTHFDVDPSGNAVYLTWSRVPEYGSSGTANDVQCTIRSNGSVEFRWRSVRNVTHSALVGFSPGNGALEPFGVDISGSMPLHTGLDGSPLTLRPTSRPVLGTVQNLKVEDIPSGSLLGAVFLGFTQHNPGIDLSAIGMPGCFQYCSQDAQHGFAVAGTSHNFSVQIPSNVSYVGLHVYAQAATLSPGFNTLGGLASNGIDMALDQF